MLKPLVSLVLPLRLLINVDCSFLPITLTAQKKSPDSEKAYNIEIIFFFWQTCQAVKIHSLILKPKPFHLHLTTVNYFQSSFTASVNSAANPSCRRGERQCTQYLSDIPPFNTTNNPNYFHSAYLQLLKISYTTGVCLASTFPFCVVDSFRFPNLLPRGSGTKKNKRDLYPWCTLSQVHIRNLNFLLQRAT